MSTYIGKELAQYKIEALIGQGGMGAVYRAWDQRLSRFVALKLMHPHLTRKPRFRERFLHEAQAVARLSHPAIVRVYAFDEWDDLLFLIMELISGDTLSAEIRRFRDQGERINLHQTLIIGAQVAEALFAAHQQNILHLDIKPGNIMLREAVDPMLPGEPPLQAVVTDFGLARLLEEGTAPGNMVGTLAYLSPEQCLEEQLDGRADLYALGIILYEMTTGLLPFEISSATSAYHKHVHEIPADPRDLQPDLPPEVAQLIMTALAKKPDERFMDAAAMAQAMRQVASLLSDEASTQHPLPDAAQTIPPRRPSLGQAFSGEREPNGAADEDTHTLSQSLFVAPPPLTRLFQRDVPVGEETLLIVRDEQVEQIVPLEKGMYRIGRLPENDIVLSDRRISGVHLRMEKKPDGWVATDMGSKNGSLLNGDPIPPLETLSWSTGQTIQLGPYYLRWGMVNESAQTPLTPALARDDGARERGAVHLVASPAQLRVKPGTRADLQLSMSNMGPQADHFLIRQDGLPHDWVTIPQEMVHMLPDASSTLPVMIQPPADSSAPAGDHPFQIIVQPVDQLEGGAVIDCVCTVAPFHQFNLDIHPSQLRNQGVIIAAVQNTGNIPHQCTLTGQDPAGALRFDTPHTTPLITPGDTVEVQINAKAARRPIIGSSRQHLFTINATGEGADTVSEQGRMTLVPLLPAWLPPLLLILLAGALFTRYFSNLNEANNTAATVVAQTATAVALVEISGLETATAVRLETVTAVAATATQEAFNVTSTAISIIGATAAAEGDDDGDGIANYIELQNGLNPRLADTDGDGLSDGEEFYRLGTNANDVDSDNDGLNDFDELNIFFTVPTNPDTDGDGLQDGADPAPLTLPTATATPLPPPTATTSPTATLSPTPLPTATATATPSTQVITLALTESGTIRFNQFATYLLTTSSGAGAPVLAVGDEYIGGLKYTTRGLLTFSLQSVPQMETLISAELTLPPAQILGDPFASLGNLVVEQVELDDTLMAEEAYLSPGTTIVPDFLLDEGEINITSEIRTAVGAGDRRIRFRFRFDQETMDGDAFADQYVLPTGSTPTIIIRYYPAAGN